MERGGPIANARKEFQHFVQQHNDTPFRGDKPYTHLQDWFHAWLQDGTGLESTGRHYETYLRTCLDIADAAFRGEIDFNYRGSARNNYDDSRLRQIQAIHDPNESDAAYYADRAAYERLVTEEEFDTQRELTGYVAVTAHIVDKMASPEGL